MSSQYDAIGSKYEVFKKFPTSILETENLKDAVLPYLSKLDKPRVLDLACGTGFYSRKLLEWGAGYVFGVDLSSGMIDAALQLSAEQAASGTLKFRVGNTIHLGKIEDEEPFDIVTASWMLNYASSLDDMTRMFKTVSSNLKDGGVFVGVTPHPVEDVDAFAKKTQEFEELQPGRWGVTVDYYERLESGEGWKTQVIGHGDRHGDDKVVFKNYHLKQSVYEQGARLGGMSGKIEWKAMKIPQRAIDQAGEDFWKNYYVYGPHMGVLIVEK